MFQIRFIQELIYLKKKNKKKLLSNYKKLFQKRLAKNRKHKLKLMKIKFNSQKKGGKKDITQKNSMYKENKK